MDNLAVKETHKRKKNNSNKWQKPQKKLNRFKKRNNKKIMIYFLCNLLACQPPKCAQKRAWQSKAAA